MFHGETFKNLKKLRFHEILFYIFLFLLPIQTRILYNPEKAYVVDYFNYHLAVFFYLTDILLVAVLVSWIIFDKHDKTIVSRLFWLILAFYCLILVGLFHVKRLDIAWYQAAKWLEVLLLILYVRETFRETNFKIASILLFLSGVSQALISLTEFHVQHSIGLSLLGEYIAPLGTPGLATIETMTGKVVRAYGTFPHPNVLGGFLILSLIFGLYLVSRATKVSQRIIVSCGTIVVMLGIFVTFSRIAWISSILIFVTWLLFHVKHKDWANLRVLLAILIVSFCTILSLFHETLKARALDSSQTALSDRRFFNGLGLDLIKHYPLGVGVGNYAQAIKDIYAVKPWQTQPAHNVFIFISAELGILGGVLFIIILFEIFSVLKKVPVTSLSFTLALAGIIFLVMGQFDHYFVTIQQGRLMFFTVLGMIAALPNLYDQRTD